MRARLIPTSLGVQPASCSRNAMKCPVPLWAPYGACRLVLSTTKSQAKAKERQPRRVESHRCCRASSSMRPKKSAARKAACLAPAYACQVRCAALAANREGRGKERVLARSELLRFSVALGAPALGPAELQSVPAAVVCSTKAQFDFTVNSGKHRVELGLKGPTRLHFVCRRRGKSGGANGS